MGVSTVTAAVIGGTAAAAGYAAGYFVRASAEEPNVEEDPRAKGMYLSKGGWKIKKEVDASAAEAPGDAKKGAELFKAKCATCHSCIEGGPTKQGPNLFGIMGKEAAVRVAPGTRRTLASRWWQNICHSSRHYSLRVCSALRVDDARLF